MADKEKAIILLIIAGIITLSISGAGWLVGHLQVLQARRPALAHSTTLEQDLDQIERSYDHK